MPVSAQGMTSFVSCSFSIAWRKAADVQNVYTPHFSLQTKTALLYVALHFQQVEYDMEIVYFEALDESL